MRVYTIDYFSDTLAAAQSTKTLIQLIAPSTMMLVLLSLEIGQEASEISEELECEIRRCSAAGDGTATTITASNVARAEVGDPDPAGTYKIDFTAEPTTYGSRPLHPFTFNTLQGYTWPPVPEERIWIPPSGRLGLRLFPNAGSLVTGLELTATMKVGEVG